MCSLPAPERNLPVVYQGAVCRNEPAGSILILLLSPSHSCVSSSAGFTASPGSFSSLPRGCAQARCPWVLEIRVSSSLYCCFLRIHSGSFLGWTGACLPFCPCRGAAGCLCFPLGSWDLHFGTSRTDSLAVDCCPLHSGGSGAGNGAWWNT